MNDSFEKTSSPSIDVLIRGFRDDFILEIRKVNAKANLLKICILSPLLLLVLN